MCGIAGFVGFVNDAKQILQDMTNSLTHRGPDAVGFYDSDNIFLGHRRLSVIDLEAKAQPMSNEDCSIWIVFNGEIYNFLALRKELEACGHIFATHTDTEVLIHGYEEWGEALLNKLSGMFAFVIWDEKQKKVFAARDQAGIKPFFYFFNGKNFVFGSELKAVIKHPEVFQEIDTNAIFLFLERQFIPAPRTIYKDVKKLMPSHAFVLTFNEDKSINLNEFCYDKIDYSKKIDLGEDEAQNIVEDALIKSVKSMLVSDVPLGVFLSGGIDSSLIAAISAQERKLDTFTIGFVGKEKGSEHEFAQKVSEHIGSNQHTLMLTPNDVLSGFDHWGDVFDEPFGDQAAMPTLLLAKFARQDVTVALAGEGADEVFGGYYNYHNRIKDEKISSVLGGALSPLPFIINMLPAQAKKDRILKAVSMPKGKRYVTIPNVFDESVLKASCTKEFLAQTNEVMSDYSQKFYEDCNSKEYLDRLLHIDYSLWLPDDLLTKVDRATMAYSLEARVPYLEQDFVKLCASLPAKFKNSNGATKYLLKKVAVKYLPHDIVYRSKQGFHMPLSEWLGSELKGSVLDALKTFANRGIFTKEALQKLEKEHYNGKRNHSGRLWCILVLEQWFRKYNNEYKINEAQ